MDLVLGPLRAAGPIRIGMPFAEAERVLHSLEGYRPPAPGERVNAGFADFESGLSVSVGRGRDGNVEAVEVYGPSRDVTVLYRDIAVFDFPAEEVIRRLSEIAPIQVEDDGMRVLAPELLLSLWRSVLPEGPDDEDGRYFEAALVAVPGYYG
ncbi:hypothetical protein [Planosporangium mesophilum]|uniref:Uncharacterized protein n=1 Tax=Planosporangium mesophilum TaxID=689768 RepID=A0A8J3TDR3_9ACTN|nr:hypothetical protein [Planosporangium mesophilum]NJC86299.1 hypothetical protein [Planosporangium mesophilum]GII23292.1 hypothetical protein Pme01_28890 [Planosporangium mesophilum]